MTYQLIEHDEIDSTNSEAKRLVLSGNATQSIIWAHKQTAGRGRYGRVWQSESGNLHMSILMPLEVALSRAAELSFVMGLSVHEILSSLRGTVCDEAIQKQQNSGSPRQASLLATPARDDYVIKLYQPCLNNPISLKWPNDIFIDDNKIGGILLESVRHANQAWLIIGVGLNIEHSPADIANTSSFLSSLREAIGDEATQTLLDCHAPNGSRNDDNACKQPRVATKQILDLIMQSFNKYYHMWQTYGFANIRTSWLKYAYRLGKEVTIGDESNRISGIFESINESGAIELKLPSGEIYTLSTGEMFF